MVRLGRCEGAAIRRRSGEVSSQSLERPKAAAPVRVGELKALPVLEDEKESSDSERLRFMIAIVFGVLEYLSLRTWWGKRCVDELYI